MITYSTNGAGLREKDVAYMSRLFESVMAVEKVILYGSRAKGNFERGSDVDLAIVGSKIEGSDIEYLHSKLEDESPTLLWFDVLHYDNLKSAALKQQIDTYGKTIFSREGFGSNA